MEITAKKNRIPAERELLKAFEGICKQLNAKNREEKLFKCLRKSKDDEVRLLVMQALNNVHLDEFSIDEVQTLLKHLNVANISAGKTEIILSSIFWILTKLIKDKNARCSEDFKKKLINDTIDRSINLLKRNCMRNVLDENEEMEKTVLSISIVNFLHFVSNLEESQTG